MVKDTDLFLMLQNIQGVVEKWNDVTSSTIFYHEGNIAMIHIVPRRENDIENNDDIYERLKVFDVSTIPPAGASDSVFDYAVKLKEHIHNWV